MALFEGVSPTNKWVPICCDEHGRVMVAQVEIAADGTPVPVASLAESYHYNPDGTLAYSQVVFGGVTYRTSYTYSAGRLTNIAKLVPQ